MGGGALAMNQRDRCRLVIMSRVRDRAMTIREASEVMRVSYRQDRLVCKQYGGGWSRHYRSSYLVNYH